MKIHITDRTTINVTKENKEKVIAYIIRLFKEHKATCVESVYYNEDIQCEGSSYFAEIAELLNMEYDDATD